MLKFYRMHLHTAHKLLNSKATWAIKDREAQSLVYAGKDSWESAMLDAILDDMDAVSGTNDYWYLKAIEGVFLNMVSSHTTVYQIWDVLSSQLFVYPSEMIDIINDDDIQ